MTITIHLTKTGPEVLQSDIAGTVNSPHLYRTALTFDGSPGRSLGRQGSSSLTDTTSQAPRRHSSPARPPRSVSPNSHVVQSSSRHIRKAASEPDAIRAVKKVKVNAPSGSRGRITARDFEDLGKSILKCAFGHFESRLCTEWPYPNEEQEISWAQRAWSRACSDKGSDAELTPQALKLVLSSFYSTDMLANAILQITERGSRIRGVIRDIARPLVKSHYGLEEPSVKNPYTAHNNRKKVDALLSLTQFYCKVTFIFSCCTALILFRSRILLT
jgi:hypothetical protein